MNCKRYRKLFSAYVDGDLDLAERRRFEDHLTECDQCTAEFAEFRKVVALTANLPPIQPSPDFDTSLRAKLSEGASESRSLFGRRFVFAFGAVCLLLAVSLGVYLYKNPGNNEDYQPEDERAQLLVGREVVPVIPGHANENAFVKFVMPSVPIIGARVSEEMDVATLEDWQEGRTFVLPVITGEQEEQGKSKMNYVIRRVSLISTSDETGL